MGAINGITSDLSCEESTIAASAAALNQVNRSLGGVTFGVDADGNYGYRKPGADTVTPFSSGAKIFCARETSTLKSSTNEFTPGGKDFWLTVNDTSVDWGKVKKILAFSVVTSSGSCGVLCVDNSTTYANGNLIYRDGDTYIYSWHPSNGANLYNDTITFSYSSVDSDNKLKLNVVRWKGQSGVSNEKIITVIYY